MRYLVQKGKINRFLYSITIRKMKNKVFVTGLSAVSALGMNLEATWQALLDGEVGIRPISHWQNQVESNLLGAAVKEYQPQSMILDRKWIKLISRQDVIGLNAAFQAIDHSGCIDYRDSLPDDKTREAFNNTTGIYVGSAGNKFSQQYDFMPLFAKSRGEITTFAEHLFETVHPMWLLKILPNNVLAYTGIQYGFKGPNQNITNHGSSGLQAIIEAYWAIALGRAERAVVVAYDTPTEPQSIFYYAQLGLISAKGSIKPFDIERDGTILGEGAAALILESEEAALTRKATCYAEILGGSFVSKAHGLFGIKVTPEPLICAMQLALESQHLKSTDIGMVVAHADGNIQSDATEAKALSTIFGKLRTPITGFKWGIGHTLSAAGIIDTALAIQSLQAKKIPGISVFQQLGNDCQGICVSSKIRSLCHPVAMVISRGCGEIASCLLLKAS